MLKKNWHIFAAAALLWLLFAQAVRGAVVSSTTFDEGPHLAVGYATLRTGDFRLQPVHIHPPLANVLAAAPLLLDPSLPDPRTIPGWEIASLSAITDTIVWKHQPPDSLALAGRLPIILLAILLGAFVYRWGTDLGRHKAGLLALVLFALDPNIVAHAPIITTDTAVTAFGFIALYCCFKSLTSSQSAALNAQKGKRQNWWPIGTGLALGAALATKVSAGLLAPVIAVIVLMAGRGSATKRIKGVVIIGLTAFVVVWATYGFEIDRVPGLPAPVPAATHIKIYQSLQQHYNDGHPSFLMGMNSTRGWLYYFPVAFLVKTPLPTMILLVMALVLAFSRTGDHGRENHSSLSIILTLGLFPVVHFATALYSSVDIGYRHLLPILPFFFVFIGWQIASRMQEARGTRAYHILRFTLYVLLAWCAITAALIFPHNLAYFNEIAGGPDNGYAWLVDSNLDWGQNLKELKAWLDARGISQVFISQFSPSRPEVYGLQAKLLLPSPRAESVSRFDPAPGWYAIGATTLQGSYTPDINTYAWFRTHEPVARLGHALFVYQVKPRQPALTWAVVCSDPAPLLAAEETKTSFGRSDLRVIAINCRQSWIFPVNKGAGGYIVPIGVQAPPGATLEARTRDPSGKPLYNVYRVGPELPVENHAPGSLQSVDGPLDLLSSRVEEMDVHPGAPVEVWTFWRVKEIPSRPLSLMAHLAKPDGVPIAVGDGLGVPIDQWQPGDVIIQRHRLLVPKETLPGRYSIQIGAYWLDDQQRWRTQDENGKLDDKLSIGSVEVVH